MMPTPTAFAARFGAPALLSALLLTTGCGDDHAPSPDAGIPPGPLLDGDCDPMVPSHCGFPFPSNVYLQDDPDHRNPSGKSVRFGATTLPKVQGGAPVDRSFFYGQDGFSPGQAPMTHLPGATTTGLATPATIEASLSPDSPTILLDADANPPVRIPHWVDLDASTTSDAQRAFLIRPAVRLKDQTRYLVAIRRVVDQAGAALPASDVFAALRDGQSHPDKSVERRRALYQDIFAKLAQAGVAKDDLQIAWDYTTASRESTTRWLLHMRDDALAKVGADGPAFVVKSVEETPTDANLLRSITITMTVPLYLNDAAPWSSSSGRPDPALVFGADGLPAQNGTMEWDVLVLVPQSVTTGVKHGLLQNGHGLLGDKAEGAHGYLARMANGTHWIAFAVDFMGFYNQDVPLALSGLGGRPELVFTSLFHRQHQGHLNQLLAMRMMMGRVAKGGIRGPSGELLVDPAWIDPAVRAYRGDSQGGIMGVTYMAISTDVVRGLLGEPGLPYNLLLNRSKDWSGYGLLLGSTFGNALDVQLALGLVQMLWDRTEPDGYAPYLADDPLPGTPVHRVLLHDGIGDHQVSTLGAHILARAIGAKNLRSNDPTQLLNRSVFGLEEASAPLADVSALVEYDFALLPEPLGNVAATDGCDPHDRVRDLTPSYAQSDEFLRTGHIDWFCDGVCNCDGPRQEGRCPETYQSQCQ